MGFWSWLTGRDDKEQDVYANKDQVETVVSNIKKIKSNEVESARSAVRSAIVELNNVSQYAATVPVDGFDTLFDGIGESMEAIGTMLQDKANDIIAYSESSWLEKAGSTLAMGLFKVGEGILSVAEDLGDGVVSFVGWLAPKDSGLEQACTEFVKKEWSHDAFNFYYESDFAKASLFTEDSGLAAGFKLVGKAGAYLYAGGVLAGQASALGLGSTKVGAAALNVASGSTWGATAAAGLGGLGSGTESGLLKGKDINAAFTNEGLKTAAISGGLAFAGGKLGEKLAKNAAIKEATRAVDKADDAFNTAQKALDQADDALRAADGGLKMAEADLEHGVTTLASGEYDVAAREFASAQASKAAAEAAQTAAKTELEAAKAALDTAKGASLSSFQGYSDALTQAGNRFGEASINVLKDGGAALGKTAAASSAIRKGAVDASIKTAEATSAQETFKESLKTLAKENPISQAVSGGKDLVTSIGSTSAKDAVSAVKGGAGSVVDALKTPIESLKSIPGALASVSPAVPGIAAMGAVAASQEIPNIQARETFELKNAVVDGENGWGDQPEYEKNIDYPELPLPELKTTENVVKTDDSDQQTLYGPPGPSNTTEPTGDGGTQFRQQDPVEDTDSTVPENIEPTVPEEIEPKKPEEIEPEDIEPTVPEEIEPVVEEDDPIKPVDPTKKDDEEATIKPVKEDENTNSTTKPTDIATSITNPTGTTTTGTTSTGGSTWSGHSGGGYSTTGGYTTGEDPVIEEPIEDAEIEDIIDETDGTMDEIVKGKVTKIPTTTVPVQPKAKTKGSTAIPIAAGLSAAAAAGLGAKAYMDRKKNSENGEDDEFYSDEWEEDDTIQIDSDNVEENNENEQDYLTPDDEYSFASDEEVEKYGARKNNELADLQ